MHSLPFGASIVIFYNNKILAVTRKTTQLFGLPGGKKDNNETLEQTAIRELSEETGITVTPQELTPIYVGVCEPDEISQMEYWVCSYSFNYDPLIHGQPTQKEYNIIPTWLTIKEFLANNAFPYYNANVMKNYISLFDF